MSQLVDTLVPPLQLLQGSTQGIVKSVTLHQIVFIMRAQHRWQLTGQEDFTTQREERPVASAMSMTLSWPSWRW